MAKQKKQKTIKQQANKYRNIKIACLGGEFISAILPFFIIGIVNRDKYFIEYDGTKFSIAFFLAMAVMGFAIWGITNKKAKNTYIAFLVKWACIALIFTLLGSLINDIAMLMWYGLIGLVGSALLDKGAEVAGNKQQAKLNAIAKAKENNDIEQASNEVK